MNKFKNTALIFILSLNTFAVLALLTLLAPESQDIQAKRVKAIYTTRELKEWIEEDRFNGTLTDEVAELYQERLVELEDYITNAKK